MAIRQKNYEIREGAHGTRIVTMRGECTPDEREGMEQNVCRRYRLITIPNAAGVILKALDGSNPKPESVTPTTTGHTFTAVKIAATVNPFAPTQTGGTYSGNAVLSYEVTYQEVGNIA